MTSIAPDERLAERLLPADRGRSVGAQRLLEAAVAAFAALRIVGAITS